MRDATLPSGTGLGPAEIARPERRDRDRLARLGAGFGVLAGLTYGLIVLGALVRAHGAGLACPDWPLCFGEVIPEIDLRVGFEFGHRVVAGFISILFAAGAVAVLRSRPARQAAGVPLAATAGLLALQVLLGALTVWQLLASWTVTSHLITGNAVAVGLLFVAASLRHPAGERTLPTGPSAWQRLGLTATAVVLLLQMVLGGLVASRFVGLACPDWPACADGVWVPELRGPVGLQVFHRLNGYLLVAALAACAWTMRSVPGIGRMLLVALVVCLAQIGVGVANVLLRLPVEITGLHSALAAGLTGTLALALRSAWIRR